MQTPLHPPPLRGLWKRRLPGPLWILYHEVWKELPEEQTSLEKAVAPEPGAPPRPCSLAGQTRAPRTPGVQGRRSCPENQRCKQARLRLWSGDSPGDAQAAGVRVFRVSGVWGFLYSLGAGRGEGRRYLVPTYSLASCSTVPLAAGVIRDSE